MTGRVQGVGFRPFIYRIATHLGLGGSVCNSPEGVIIEVEGQKHLIDSFLKRVQGEPPVAAHIDTVEVNITEPKGDSEFIIAYSQGNEAPRVEITPDMATCRNCLNELFDPNDRRYGYGMINCTDCGPRYSIVLDTPYDRRFTTMNSFDMCQACQSEYDDPNSRRFHAEPNACEVCGPEVWYRPCEADGNHIGVYHQDAYLEAAKIIRHGGVLCIRGIGGFHLACDATNDDAIQRLRGEKGRGKKPFALMVPDVDMAKRIVELDERAVRLLSSPVAPVLLSPTQKDRSIPISDFVAPGLDRLGVMLAYTPMHHLLFQHLNIPLVMTSGNLSGEPLTKDNEDALERLGQQADGYLLHDRPIERRLDDSVIALTKVMRGPDMTYLDFPIRRARGLAPQSIQINWPIQELLDDPMPNLRLLKAPLQVMGLGALLKSSVCLLEVDQRNDSSVIEGRAILSEYIGDLSYVTTYRHYQNVLDQMCQLWKIKPKNYACDLHPDIPSTHEAYRRTQDVTHVQHHHAHVVACMTENHVTKRTLGVVCDGVGYGADGRSWGGELLDCSLHDFRRMGCIKPFGLLGGDKAAVETWRPALALIELSIASIPEAWSDHLIQWVEDRFAFLADSYTVFKQLSKSSITPDTSALGRLFDAIGFILGVCDENSYEAESGMLLETLAEKACKGPELSFILRRQDSVGVVLDHAYLIRDICFHCSQGVVAMPLAYAFHQALINGFTEAVMCCTPDVNKAPIALTGGCFANQVLLRGMYEALSEKGYQVLTHRLLPPGDGSLAMGQAVVSAVRSIREYSITS